MWDADVPAKMILQDLVDEMAIEVAFEIHRYVKLGVDKIIEGVTVEPEVTFSNGTPSTSNGGGGAGAMDQIGVEIFGTTPTKKQLECVCPNCSRSLVASKFATHLERCIGMGRISSRLASKRIATTVAASQASNSSIAHSDDDDEWTMSSDRKRKRNYVREKVSTRRPKKGRSNGDGGSSGSGSLPPSPAETLTPPDLYSNRIGICGVVSEHTGRTCTRSIRCPKHAHVRRNAMISGENGEAIDVDSLDDDGTGRSWIDQTIAPSPADSTSNSSSSSLKHRGTGSSAIKGKKRSHNIKGKNMVSSGAAFLY